MLIQGLKKGREDAFEELVRLFGNKVYNTCLGFVQNEQDAEELAQDVFIKVFERIKDFREEASLGTWIYRIAVTHSLDFLRRKKRHKRGFLISVFTKKEDEWDQPDFHHPGVAAEQKEKATLLFKAISQLPDQQQSAFVLQKLEGLSLIEIAAILDTTVSAVESLLHRAKSNLKKILEHYYLNHGS
jgi:RNA polymerase sigma factor (sigma-70 family)